MKVKTVKVFSTRVPLAIAVQGEAGHVSLRLRLGLRLRADLWHRYP